MSVPAHLSIRVPADWHVLRGWLSDVVDPAPRLAVASFPARLSRHTCECGFPNVLNFPRDGAFTFVWEYPAPSARGLARTPDQNHPVRTRTLPLHGQYRWWDCLRSYRPNPGIYRYYMHSSGIRNERTGGEAVFRQEVSGRNDDLDGRYEWGSRLIHR